MIFKHEQYDDDFNTLMSKLLTKYFVFDLNLITNYLLSEVEDYVRNEINTPNNIEQSINNEFEIRFHNVYNHDFFKVDFGNTKCNVFTYRRDSIITNIDVNNYDELIKLFKDSIEYYRTEQTKNGLKFSDRKIFHLLTDDEKSYFKITQQNIIKYLKSVSENSVSGLNLVKISEYSSGQKIELKNHFGDVMRLKINPKYGVFSYSINGSMYKGHYLIESKIIVTIDIFTNQQFTKNNLNIKK